jgi:hypothetical protein
VPLKPGNLGAATDTAARPAAFADSLADLIERELDALLQAEGSPPLVIDNSSDSRDRRLLFVAVARAVVRHLALHADAFKVNTATPTTTITIETEL